MTDSEFQTQMDRLYDRWSERAFRGIIPDIRMAVMNLSATDFAGMIGMFLATRRSAPLPVDFKAEAARIKSGAKRYVPPAQTPEPPCVFCNQSGVIQVRHDQTQTNLLMICECPVGEIPTWVLPRWDRRFSHDFIIIPYNDPSALKWKPGTSGEANSVKEKVAEWALKIALSQAFWSDYFNKEQM